MGSYKDMLIDADNSGWMPNNDDKYVCAECIEDKALGKIVTSNARSKKCTYCGRQSQEPIAATLDIVTEHMAECIAGCPLYLYKTGCHLSVFQRGALVVIDRKTAWGKTPPYKTIIRTVYGNSRERHHNILS